MSNRLIVLTLATGLCLGGCSATANDASQDGGDDQVTESLTEPAAFTFTEVSVIPRLDPKRILIGWSLQATQGAQQPRVFFASYREVGKKDDFKTVDCIPKLCTITDFEWGKRYKILLKGSSPDIQSQVWLGKIKKPESGEATFRPPLSPGETEAPDFSDKQNDMNRGARQEDRYVCDAWRDADCDGIPNEFDWDIDNDNMPNDFDFDANGDGLPPVPWDQDEDGIDDSYDLDLDGDLIPNSMDPDIDGDQQLNDYDRDIDGDNSYNEFDSNPFSPRP